MPLRDGCGDMPVVRVPGDVKVLVIPKNLRDGLLFVPSLNQGKSKSPTLGARCQALSSSFPSIVIGDVAR